MIAGAAKAHTRKALEMEHINTRVSSDRSEIEAKPAFTTVMDPIHRRRPSNLGLSDCIEKRACSVQRIAGNNGNVKGETNDLKPLIAKATISESPNV
jgi:hypothetical protein